MLNLNTKPYFDDYNEDKGFHRVLFRPSFAVQARELNQMQTILQNQIKRFGSHMFKNGAMIKPGGCSFDGDIRYVKLEPIFAGIKVELSPWLGRKIQGEYSGVTAEVINVANATNDDINPDPPTLFIKIITGGSREKKRKMLDATGAYIYKPVDPNDPSKGTEIAYEDYTEIYDNFVDGEKIFMVDNKNYQVRVANGFIEVPEIEDESTQSQFDVLKMRTDTFASSGIGCGAVVDEGIYYINGYFVKVQKQSIIIDKYDNHPTVKIGLRLYDTITTPEMDASLQDNAMGSYNYAAPGAHRYTMRLALEYIPYISDATTDTDKAVTEEGDHFILLVAVVDGEVTFQCEVTEYAELEKTLARRTYDESGNYTVKPFMLSTYQHLRDPDNPRYKLGKWYGDDPRHEGNKNKLALQMSAGKAYVFGYEINKTAPTWLELDKARDVEHVNNETISSVFGNYVYVTRVFQLPDIDKMQRVEFFTSDLANDGDQGTGKMIGYAYVRAIEREAMSGDLPSEYLYKLYLFDIHLDAPFSAVRSIVGVGTGTSRPFTCTPILNEALYPGYIPYSQQLMETTKIANIFKTPQKYVSTLNVGGTLSNPSDASFTIQKSDMIAVSNGATTFTITIEKGNSIDTAHTRWMVFDTSAQSISEGYIKVESVDVNDEGTGAVITLERSPSGKIRVIYPLNRQECKAKQKVLQFFNHNQDTPNRGERILNPKQQIDELGCIRLSKGDGVRLVGVWMLKEWDTNKSAAEQQDKIQTSLVCEGSDVEDITERFVFDGGQNDCFIENATLRLRSGFTLLENPIIVSYTYFEHIAGGDYYCIDSYYKMDDPGSTIKTKMGREDIPSYTLENGETVELSDCIDFRPLILNGAIAGSSLYPNTYIRFDYDYYLSRIDKVYISADGKFGVARGIPAKYPIPPETPEDAMLLWKLHLSPYTENLSDIRKEYEENKRYTMRDIGKLEKRIDKLEYYVALSLLEIQTLQMQITDTSGNNRFKNGFIVDPFNSHEFGERRHIDYKCSIDIDNQEMRPTFATFFAELIYNEKESIHTQRTSTLVTLPYESVTLIEQPQMSNIVNVNPYAVRAFDGSLTMQPDSDQWFEKTKVGNKKIDYSPNYEWQTQITENLWDGEHWGDWYMTGSKTTTSVSSQTTKSKALIDSKTSTSTSSQVTNTKVLRKGHEFDEQKYKGQSTLLEDTIKTTTTTTTQNTYLTTELTATTTTKTTTEDWARDGWKGSHTTGVATYDFGDRTVGLSDIQYMRNITILMKASMMKPNTIVYPFFDDVDVAQYCMPLPIIDVAYIESKDGVKGAFFHTDDTLEEVLSPDPADAGVGWDYDEFCERKPQSDCCTVIFNHYRTGAKKDENGKKIKDSEGKDIIEFKHAQIIIADWRWYGESASLNANTKIRKGTILYGVKSGARCKLLTDIEEPSWGGQIKTNKNGNCALLFDLPCNDNMKFKTGERLFVLNDQPDNSVASQTRVEGKFTSRGYDLQQEGTIVSTKTIQLDSTPIHDTKQETHSTSSTSYSLKTKVEKETKTSTSTSTSTRRKNRDPLAQSFIVDMDGGCFVTAINVCFYSKDEELPVRCSILECENGMPTRNTVPYSTCIKYPEQITCVVDPKTEDFVWTRFEMEAPVYLRADVEYAIFLITDSLDYAIWQATMGQTDARSGKPIQEQPYSGVIFKSQNASTWTEDQESDMCFKIERALFDITANGQFYADNGVRAPIYPTDGNGVFETFSNSALVRIHHENHGLYKGAKVNISGLEADQPYNGIPGSAINGNSKDVKYVEMDSFVIEADNPSENRAISSGKIAEISPIYDTNIPYDVLQPNITNLIFDSTSIKWGYIYTEGRSVGAPEEQSEGGESPGTLIPSSGWLDLAMQEDNYLPSHGIIASKSNSDTQKPWSLRVCGLMTSSMRNLSPVIDLNRCSTVLVNNRVDYPRLIQFRPVMEFFKDSPRVKITMHDEDVPHIMADGSMVYMDCSGAEGDLITETSVDPITGVIIANTTKNNDSPTLLPIADPSGAITNNGASSGTGDGRKDASNMFAYTLEGWYYIERDTTPGGTDGDSVFWITMPGNATRDMIVDLANVTNTSPYYNNVKRFNIQGISFFHSRTHYRYVPEIEPENASTASRYFTRKVTLENPSTAAKIMFTCSCEGEADFEVWVKTQNQYAEEDFGSIKWWRVNDPSFSRRISSDRNDWYDYECTVEFTDGSGEDDLNEFTSISVKLVMKSTNQVKVPIFKNLRVICLAT